jgi:hypothetical protein
MEPWWDVTDQPSHADMRYRARNRIERFFNRMRLDESASWFRRGAPD